MKRFSFPFCVVLFSLTAIFTGCSSDDNNPAAPVTNPTADFDMIGDTTTPATISFINLSTNADRYDWDFGDGRTSTLESPEMTFNTPGTFDITLTARDIASSKSDVIVKQLIISPPDPVADFTMSGTTVTPATISFNNNSINADRYQWDFGDGRTSIQENPVMAFNTYGEFEITMVARMGSTSKSDTVRKQLTITPSRVFLDSIIVEQIPFVTSNGVSWDLASGPDFYLQFENDNDDTLLSSNIQIDVIPSDLPLRYIVSPSYEIVDWDENYWIYMYDVDDSYNEFIDLVGLFIDSNVLLHGYQRTYDLGFEEDTRVRIVVHWQ